MSIHKQSRRGWGHDFENIHHVRSSMYQSSITELLECRNPTCKWQMDSQDSAAATASITTASTGGHATTTCWWVLRSDLNPVRLKPKHHSFASNKWIGENGIYFCWTNLVVDVEYTVLDFLVDFFCGVNKCLKSFNQKHLNRTALFDLSENSNQNLLLQHLQPSWRSFPWKPIHALVRTLHPLLSWRHAVPPDHWNSLINWIPVQQQKSDTD